MCLSIRRYLILGLGLILSACSSTPDNAEVIEALARKALSDIQPTSTRKGIEYCGLVMRRASGELYATEPTPGEASTCPFVLPIFYEAFEPGDIMVATYHTHSAASQYGGPEWPSYQDLKVTKDLEFPGYIITPGGRFWYIDKSGDFAFQVCGLGCLPSDPDFKASLGNLSVPDRVTADELRERQGL